jgi:hypothetical protein
MRGNLGHTSGSARRKRPLNTINGVHFMTAVTHQVRKAAQNAAGGRQESSGCFRLHFRPVKEPITLHRF